MTTSQHTINVTNYADDYSLGCSFRGIPEPEVSWYFDGKLISSSSRYTVNNTASQNGVFHYIHSELKFEGMRCLGIWIHTNCVNRIQSMSLVKGVEWCKLICVTLSDRGLFHDFIKLSNSKVFWQSALGKRIAIHVMVLNTFSLVSVLSYCLIHFYEQSYATWL